MGKMEGGRGRRGGRRGLLGLVFGVCLLAINVICLSVCLFVPNPAASHPALPLPLPSDCVANNGIQIAYTTRVHISGHPDRFIGTLLRAGRFVRCFTHHLIYGKYANKI